MGVARRVLVLAALVLAAAPAAASAYVPSGIVPDLPTGARVLAPSGKPHANVDYQGGPVMHSNRTHIIFWNPSNAGLSYDPGYQSLFTGFLANVAADSRKPTNVFGLTGQYSDHTGIAAYDSTFAGAIQDTDAASSNCALPPTGPGWSFCLKDSTLENELQHVIAARSLPVTPHDLYFFVLPSGFGVCQDDTILGSDCSLGGSAPGSFCGYHSAFGTFGAPYIYAVIPFNAVDGHCDSGAPRPNGNSADPSINSSSHEQIEAITDPLPAGPGNTQSGWVDNTNREEVADLCATTFGPALGTTSFGAYNELIHGGHYFLQETWSNVDGGCVPRDEADSASAKGPGAARAHHRVKFSASASDPDGHIVSYTWKFGDRQHKTGRNVKHKYAHPGTYTVTMTARDDTGNEAVVTFKIKIRRK